jgi:hypothetical protein
MPSHFGNYLTANGHSPGIMLVSQKDPIGPVIEELLLIWSASVPQEWENRIVQLPL